MTEHQGEVVKVLLDAGAKVSDDAWEASPLFLALLAQDPEAEALLRKRGAKLLPKEQAFEELVKQGSGTGKKQVFEAVEKGRTDLVKLQLEAGMDVNVDLFDGNTPLHIAAGSDQREVARLLIRAGADVNAHNRRGTPVIGFAIVRQHHEMVKLLAEAGAKEE